MTLEQLSSVYNLKTRRADMLARLDELRACSPQSPALDGLPHGGTYGRGKTERLAVAIVDLAARIENLELEFWHEYRLIYTWINDIPDSLTRQVFRARFLDCQTWPQVARTVGGDTTAESVKKICYRYLRQQS